MNTLFFWNQWNKPYKYFYWFLLLVAGITFSLIIFGWAYGHELTIRWSTDTTLEPSLVGVYDFTRNFFSFSVPSETYLAADYFSPAPVTLTPLWSYVCLTLLAIGFVWCLSIVSFFELYWYMGGMLALLGFCSGLQLDILEIAGRQDKIPLIVLFVSYGGLSYYFNSFAKNVNLTWRLAAFSILTVIFIVVIAFTSTVEHPFLYLAAYSASIPLYTMLFIVFFQGYFIQKFILQMVSGSRNMAAQANSLAHFGIISLLYLGSLFLLLLKKLYIVDLNLVYLHPFVVFLVSSSIGIWQFRKQTELFGGRLPFVPAGALLYLAVMVLAASGLFFACVTDNYGLMEAYERYMLYGYLFSGFVFVIYIGANFITYFDKKISVYDEVYNSRRLTFWAVPAISITMGVVFFAYQKKYPHELHLSGILTAKGDVYAYEANYPLAFQYYRNALSYDYPNPRANYAIASLTQALGDKISAQGYYENAVYRNPQPEAYAGLASAHLENGEYFQAVFALQDGLKKFPDNGQLLNNLGLAYFRTSLTDSVVHYLNRAANVLSDPAVPHSNMLYVLNKRGYGALADSLSQVYAHTNISYEINRMATFLMNGRVDRDSIQLDWIPQSGLKELEYAYCWNYTLLHPEFSYSFPEKLQTDSTNIQFRDGLQYLQAWQLYRQGNALEAMTVLENLIAGTVNNSAYARTLAYWMLEQDSYEEAERLFKLTLPAFQFDDVLNLALVQMRSDKNAARESLRMLMVHPDSTKRPVAQAFYSMLEANYQEAENLPAGMKIYYCAVNQSGLSDKEVLDLLLKMDATTGATVWADRLEYLVDLDIRKAVEWAANVPEQQNPACHYALAKYARVAGNADMLKNYINLEWSRPRLKTYYSAYLQELAGNVQGAAADYLKALKIAPMYDNLYLSAMQVINKAGRGEEGYAILVDAIRRKPDSKEIQRAYLEQCIFMGYSNYAAQILELMDSAVSPSERIRYQARIDSLNTN